MRELRRLVSSAPLWRLLGVGVAVSLTAVLALPGGLLNSGARAAKPTASLTTGERLAPAEAGAAEGGLVMVVLRDQHSNLNLDKQGELRTALAHHDQAPILASIAAHGGSNYIQPLVSVNAVAANLPVAEVTRLRALPSVAKVVPDLALPVNGAEVPQVPSVAAANIETANPPAACPATSTSPTGVTNVVEEPEEDALLHASTGNTNSPDMANSIATGQGVVVAISGMNQLAGNPNFTRPNGQEVVQNVPSNDTTLDAGNDESYEDASSVAAQGTVVYPYDEAVPYSGLPASCRFYIEGISPGATLVDSSDITTPPSTNANSTTQLDVPAGDELESQIIAGIDRVTAAALPPAQANVISESFSDNNYVPQIINTANDAAVAAGVAVTVSSGDSGDSAISGSTFNPLAADPNVLAIGAVDGFRIAALAFGFQSYQTGQIAELSSGGVGVTGRVVDLVSPGWYSGMATCGPHTNGCNANYPMESSQGTSAGAPTTAGAIADLDQAYYQTHNSIYPAPAMVKDILTGTAQDLDDPSNEQGAGLLDVYAAVKAAQQMPGTTDPNGPGDSPALIPSPSQLDVMGSAGTSTNQSVSLYNTNTAATTVTGTYRSLGPEFQIGNTVTESISAPPASAPVPPQGATAATPITFNVPPGVDRLDAEMIWPDPSHNNILEVQLFNPQGTFVQESYDYGDPSSGTTTLVVATNSGASNISVASTRSATVGQPVTIDTGSLQETDTVAAVGKADTNTTLAAAASQGATNIKVGTDTNVTVGDTLTINAGATNVEVGTVTAVGTTTANGTGITLASPLQFGHALGTTVFDPGTGITLTTPLVHSHAVGASVVFTGIGSVSNVQDVQVSEPMAGTWTADIIWSGNDVDISTPPETPGPYTGPMSFEVSGQNWQYAPASTAVTIQPHQSATIPLTIPFNGTPGDYPESVQFTSSDGAATSFPVVARTLIPTGYNIPFNTLITTSVGRGIGQINQYDINVPPGSTQISVNLNTPDASTDNPFTYYLTYTGDTNSSCSAITTNGLAAGCTSIGEPVNGVNNGTLTVNNPTPGLWQVDVKLNLDADGREFTQVVNGTATVTPGTSPGGTVPSTLSVSLGSVTPTFGTFVPGTAANYTTTVPATVTSTAQNATLQASDGSTTFPGHLVNTSASGGPYAMPQGLQVDATSGNASASGGGVYADLSKTNPATILTYNAPVANDVATIGFLQPVAATDALRTGSYTKTITVTLSTNTP